MLILLVSLGRDAEYIKEIELLKDENRQLEEELSKRKSAAETIAVLESDFARYIEGNNREKEAWITSCITSVLENAAQARAGAEGTEGAIVYAV